MRGCPETKPIPSAEVYPPAPVELHRVPVGVASVAGTVDAAPPAVITPTTPTARPRHSRRSARRPFTFIFEEDPDLAQALPPDERRAATELFKARVIFADSARWEPPAIDPATTFGLLLLDGLIGRRVRVGTAVATELLGTGDLLRPWQEPAPWHAMAPELDWRVFRPARLAVLDERITRLIGRRPELVVAFSGRLLRRIGATSQLTAISHLTRVEDRLLATLWHLASTWGRVTPQGVSIPFRLTHEVLGEILGAQRPSVTTAMRHLTLRGHVLRGAHGGYVLPRDPPDWSDNRS